MEFFSGKEDASLDACIILQHGNRSPHEKEMKWTSISELTVDSRMVNVKFKILEKEEPQRVAARSTGKSHLVCKCVVGDESAIITLTLWDEDIEYFEVSNTYELVKGHVSLYEECMNLGRGRLGEFRQSNMDIVKINFDTDMSRPFMGRPKRRRKERSPTGRTFSGTAGRESRGYPARKSF